MAEKMKHAETEGKLHKAGTPHKHGRGRNGRPPLSREDRELRRNLKALLDSAPARPAGFLPPTGKMENAEMYARIAGRKERENPALASRLHEKAGDIFSKTGRDGSASGRQARGAEGAPQPEAGLLAEPPALMHDEAIQEYRRAAELVRETDPKRAEMLDGKVKDAEGLKLVDGFAIEQHRSRRTGGI